MIDGDVLFLTIISTTISIIIAIIQLYLKIKEGLENAIKEIVNQQLEEIKIEVAVLKNELEDLKQTVKNSKK